MGTYLNQPGLRQTYVDLFLAKAPALATTEVDDLVKNHQPARIKTDDFRKMLEEIVPVIVQQHGGPFQSALELQKIAAPVPKMVAKDKLTPELQRASSQSELMILLEKILI
jgi:hypothetical protein